MVWRLSPIHPSLGPSEYYFTSPGVYKVGRKDCAVAIQTDKTVSRLHAEFIVERVIAWSVSKGFLNVPRASIRLRDFSKFGTFVNKETFSRPVFSLPDQESTLKEGDIITFGTNNSTFRLGFHSLLVHVPAFFEKSKRDAVLDAVFTIGGHVIEKWCEECTHLLVEEGSLVTETVMEAIIRRKPVISIVWIEAVASRITPAAEFPSLSRFAPTLVHRIVGNATRLKIADPETRGILFRGFTFFVGALNMYENKEHLRLLIEVSGGEVVFISQRHSDRQVSNVASYPEKMMLIVPSTATKLQRWLSADDLKFVLHMPRTSEEKIVSAMLSGQMDSATLQLPASPASSASTDETVEADGSEHGDKGVILYPIVERGATSCSKSYFTTQGPINTAGSQHQGDVVASTSTYQNVMVRSRDLTGSSIGSLPASRSTLVNEQVIISTEKIKRVRETPRGNLVSQRPDMNSDSKVDMKSIKVEGKSNAIFAINEDSKTEVIFSSALVHRGVDTSNVDHSPTVSAVRNFKRFKKKQESSGNSFGALVAFAKEPYRESEYGQEVKEYMQQEKRRKEAEALAEELFNAEQLKRQKASSSGPIAKQKSQGKVKDR